MSCEIDHNNTHKIIYFTNIMLNKEKMREEITQFGLKIDKLKTLINNMKLKYLFYIKKYKKCQLTMKQSQSQK